MPAKRFRIAFSFTGEKRNFVSNVARILAERFVETAILYDKFHEAEFARARLGRYLPKLYHEDSDLVVVVICRDYPSKEWCGLEWDAIFDLLKKRREDEVMLANYDRASVDGLYSDAGFIELDDKTPAQFVTLILERLALNEGHPKEYYTAGGARTDGVAKTPVLNNLPALQPFFGREEELQTIREALDPNSRTWGALIDGPGGMGKTSLAVRVAYDCPPDQFARKLFISVKDREMEDDGVRRLGSFLLPGFVEMLNELAHLLAAPEIAKAAEAQRIQLLHQALEGTRALLILDNLESLPKPDRDQVLTFVKRLPQGCKAILTSRRRIGSSADTLILEKLSQDAALATLADLARRNKLLARTSEAERITLYKQTGGKPLLLRWTAGQLGQGSCRTFTDAIAYLRSCPKDNDPLEFIFGDLARAFTPQEEKLLCALTYFTLPATVEHIRALTNPLPDGEKKAIRLEYDEPDFDADAEETGKGGEREDTLSEAEVQTALHTLCNRSLVVPDQEETHFALVPLVADFLRKAKPEVVAETGDRLEKHAYALIVENGHSNDDRFPVLDAAWPGVAPALPRFLAGDNARLQTVCGALFRFLDFTGHWDELLALNEQAERRAVAAGDHDKAGRRAYQAGWVHSLRGQADEVLACADRAAAHWDQAFPKGKGVQAGTRERAIGIRLRGIGHQLKKDYPAAIAAYRELVALHRSLSAESVDVANALNDLAVGEKGSGDFAAAERDYREALRIARAVGHAEMMAGLPGNLAALALDREDWPGAEALAREALPLSEKIGRQEMIAEDCRRLAKALARQGKGAEGLPYARRSVEIYQKLGSPDLEAASETLRECGG